LQLFKELQRRNVFRVAIGYIVSCWLLVQVADLVLENIGAPDWVMQTIMLVLALGFPVVVFFSWAYEVTPEGIKLESEIDRSESITHVTGRKLDRAIVAVLVIALAYFAYDKFVLDPKRDAALIEAATQAVTEQAATEPEEAANSDKSIAVLPFVNMSSDEEQEYFSDGLSEELLNLLAKIPELQVAARTSSFSLKGKDLQISEVGEILKVAHVLEGSVRKAGNQVRITAQLIKADDGYHMWSETYDRTLENIFAIQDEIAAEVVTQLKVTLLGDIPTVEATDPEAYALFLQARHLSQQLSEEGYERSHKLLQQVVAIDPGYAAAWSELARNYNNRATFGMLAQEEGFRLAREAAEKAVAIDPNDAMAHLSIGFSQGGDLAAAAPHYERALELEPANPVVLRNAANLLANLGRLEQAIALGEYVVIRDPANPVGHNNLGLHYLMTGRLNESIASYRTALTLSPDAIGVHYFIGEALLFKGEPDAALATFAEEPDDEWRVKGTALALYSLGRSEDFEIAFDELREGWGEEWPSEIAQVYAWVGNADEAFEWLDQAIEQKEAGLENQFQKKFFAPLHTDPRWAAFREKSGTSEAQLGAIKFEVTLPE
jgi:TolB-like protein/Tfp pilus assembly protein PilF